MPTAMEASLESQLAIQHNQSTFDIVFADRDHLQPTIGMVLGRLKA
jgi:hypothetical protein